MLTRATQKNADNIQITDVKNKIGNITTELADIKKIIRKHYGQLFTQVFDNID